MTELEIFKKECTVGYCIAQWEQPSGNRFEMWMGKKGVLIIQIYSGDSGFEVYKQSPDPELDATIEWANS